MSVNAEIIYQLKTLLSTVDVITDREDRTYDTASLSYTLYNLDVTSILEARGTASAVAVTFTETTDYTLTSDSITFTAGGTKPDNASTFYVDYLWTRTITTGEGYPCDPENLPYIGINIMSNVERPLNVGLFSSRGTDTVLQNVLVYVTLFEAKETDVDANNHYSRKELLNMTSDAVQTKMLQNKKLGDYIVDMQLNGTGGRQYDELVNAYFIQHRYTVTAIKEARF